MDRRPERSTYTPFDFVEWAQAGTLSLTPKFQRRHVWTTPARSYLIDTLLLGMPVPPIYIRIVQNDERNRIIREVIDGQQRISAILDFVSGKFSLSKNVESPVAGKRFSSLSKSSQDSILQYSFICEVFHGIEDAEVLSIFARLNTHSVKLNSQELRNGKWFGYFKRASYDLALEHLPFWTQMRIFSDSRIARMAEVELTSELLILGLDGLQDKKSSIDDFYEKYDEAFEKRTESIDRFQRTIDAITTSCGDILPSSEFRRTPLFYSLYAAVYHRLFRVPGVSLSAPSKKKRLSVQESEKLADAVRDLSSLIALARSDSEDAVPSQYRRFVTACLRQTDNIKPRTYRLKTLYSRAFG